MSIIVANHNGLRFLKLCLPALHLSAIPAGWSREIIVVDNGSTDGSADFARSVPGTIVLEFEKGLGFGGANNAARQIVTGDVVCFLNNDTVPSDNWLSRPLEILADESVAAVGSRLVFMHDFLPVEIAKDSPSRVFVGSQIFGGPLDSKLRWSLDARHEELHLGRKGRWLKPGQALYVPKPIAALDGEPRLPLSIRFARQPGAQPGVVKIGGRSAEVNEDSIMATLSTFEGLRVTQLIQNAGGVFNDEYQGGDYACGELANDPRFAKDEVVPSVCGAAFFVRKVDLDRVGWFPEYYHVYYEDTDLSLLLRAGGKKLVHCASSIVYHYHTGTNREWSPFFIQNVTRSSLLFLTRHAPAAAIRRGALHSVREVFREWKQWDRWIEHPSAKTMPWTMGLLDAAKALPKVAALRVRDRTAARPNLLTPRRPYIRPT